jgi:hypothetical protein
VRAAVAVQTLRSSTAPDDWPRTCNVSDNTLRTPSRPTGGPNLGHRTSVFSDPEAHRLAGGRGHAGTLVDAVLDVLYGWLARYCALMMTWSRGFKFLMARALALVHFRRE